MKCGNCYRVNNEENNFCELCGNPLKGIPAFAGINPNNSSVTRTKGSNRKGIIVAVCIVVGIFPLLFLIGKVASPVFDFIDEAINSESLNKTFENKKEGFFIKAPRGWSDCEEDESGADLLIANNPYPECIGVYKTSKQDMEDNMGLDSFVSRTIQLHEKCGFNVEEKEMRRLTIDGCNACQFEFAAKIDGMNYRFLETIVETEYSFFSIRGYTLKSKFDEKRDLLINITDSFNSTDRMDIENIIPLRK